MGFDDGVQGLQGGGEIVIADFQTQAAGRAAGQGFQGGLDAGVGVGCGQVILGQQSAQDGQIAGQAEDVDIRAGADHCLGRGQGVAYLAENAGQSGGELVDLRRQFADRRFRHNGFFDAGGELRKVVEPERCRGALQRMDEQAGIAVIATVQAVVEFLDMPLVRVDEHAEQLDQALAVAGDQAQAGGQVESADPGEDVCTKGRAERNRLAVSLAGGGAEQAVQHRVEDIGIHRLGDVFIHAGGQRHLGSSSKALAVIATMGVCA